MFRPVRNALSLLVPDEPPLELQLVGRTLLHAALVGLLAGLFGSAFLFVLEHIQHYVLESGTGYVPLRAAGEGQAAESATSFRWWLLLFIPAVGGLASGWVSRFAPEVRGGGGNAAIDAFHNKGGQVRRRVLWAKPLAAIATLGTGGAGGREGPTMQIGAAIGSMIGRSLSLTARERRTLMVAGIGAGISAVFRTPLGAALLAIEVLYRDDFESEALIPCVLASVVAYSVALTVFGTEPLFGKLPHFPFHPSQLPLYLGLALVVAIGATAFEHTMQFCMKMFGKLPGPAWIRPAVGGLALGLFAVILLLSVDPWIGNGHRGLGVLGGGYGAGQLAITGAEWLPGGWQTVELLVALGVAKIVAASLTIGSGGAAGDFAPSIAIGGVLGGAFGAAASLLLHDPSIQPGAFALVGMAAFYAGIANTPLAALVMICEVAGSYDLLVPLMLTEAVALIALRRVNLYPAQPKTTKESPIHASLLVRLRCSDVATLGRAIVSLRITDTMATAAHVIETTPDQDVFPILDDGLHVVGLLSAEALRSGGALDGNLADVMVAPLTFQATDSVRSAAILLSHRDLRAAPIVDGDGKLVAMLDQQDIMKAITAPSTSGDTLQ